VKGFDEMTKRKPILATLALACTIPLVGFAADPPKRGPDGRGDGRQGNIGPNRGGPGGDWRDREKELSKEFEKFCEAHAPKRWAELKDPTNNNKPRMFSMLWKFRQLKSLEKTDLELYKIQVSQIESEDAEYGTLVELKKAQQKATATTEQLDKLKAQLRDQAALSVELRLKEKGLRIERLAKLLDAERKATENDKQNQPKLIETRFAQMLEDGPDFFNPKPPSRRDNDGERGGANNAPTPPPNNGAQAFPDIR